MVEAPKMTDMKEQKDTQLIKVWLKRSPTGKPLKLKKVLKGLGLSKINKVELRKKSPEIMGMIYKVRHLVEWEDYTEESSEEVK